MREGHIAYGSVCEQWTECVSALSRVLILKQEKKKKRIVLASSSWNEIINYQGSVSECVSVKGEKKRGEKSRKKKLPKIVFKFVYALSVLICFHP